jgi:hypothetical protein
LISRLVIHGNGPQGKEVKLDYTVEDSKIDESTDFNPEEETTTLALKLKIPVLHFFLTRLKSENMSNGINFNVRS